MSTWEINQITFLYQSTHQSIRAIPYVIMTCRLTSEAAPNFQQTAFIKGLVLDLFTLHKCGKKCAICMSRRRPDMAVICHGSLVKVRGRVLRIIQTINHCTRLYEPTDPRIIYSVINFNIQLTNNMKTCQPAKCTYSRLLTDKPLNLSWFERVDVSRKISLTLCYLVESQLCHWISKNGLCVFHPSSPRIYWNRK